MKREHTNMKKNRIFIIGNGFDLANGIDTSYKSFHRYLKNFDKDTFNLTCALFWDQYDESDYLWSNFEKNLSSFNIAAFDFYMDFQTLDVNPLALANAKIEKVVNAWKNNLYAIFKLWIYDIFQNIIKTDCITNNSDLFINFNYTCTLEQLYGVPSKNILHIHNTVNDNILILGHGVEFNLTEILATYGLIKNGEVISTRSEFIDAYLQYYIGSLLKKDVQAIIHNKMGFFDNCSDIEEIIVLGHSFGDVDLPYFKYLADRFNGCQWRVGFYNENEKRDFEESLKKIGVNNFKFEETRNLITKYFKKIWTKDTIYKFDSSTCQNNKTWKITDENYGDDVQEILHNLSSEEIINHDRITKLADGKIPYEKPKDKEVYYLKLINSYQKQLCICRFFKKELAWACASLGLYYQSIGKDEKAIEQYTTALREYFDYGLDALEDSISYFIISLHNLATIYFKHDEIEIIDLQIFDMLSSFDLLALITQAINTYASSCFLLGLVFMKRNDFNRANIFFTIAKNAYEQIGAKPSLIVPCYFNKAKCLFELNNYNEANECLSKAASALQRIEN